jgi:hypothetical protein
LKTYGIDTVEADSYAAEWVTEAHRDHGITVKRSKMSASELYLNFLPMISNGTVELLENKRLHAQLTGLERRARSGGKDLVTHYPGGHDDLANATAGACVMASEMGGARAFAFLSDEDVMGEVEQDFSGSGGAFFKALCDKMTRGGR